MHIQQVSNIVDNGRHRDFAHSLSRLERVCAYVPGKHMFVSPSTFSDYVQSQDIVVALCNCKEDCASIGLFNILDLTHWVGHPQLKGPHRSVGVRIPNPRGHAKVAFTQSIVIVLEPGKSSECRIFTSNHNQRHLYSASSCKFGAQNMDGLMRGKQRGTPASCSSNTTPTWAKLFNMFVQQTTFVPIWERSMWPQSENKLHKSCLLGGPRKMARKN